MIALKISLISFLNRYGRCLLCSTLCLCFAHACTQSILNRCEFYKYLLLASKWWPPFFHVQHSVATSNWSNIVPTFMAVGGLSNKFRNLFVRYQLIGIEKYKLEFSAFCTTNATHVHVRWQARQCSGNFYSSERTRSNRTHMPSSLERNMSISCRNQVCEPNDDE